MQYEPKIRQQNGKDYIFCEWRRKYVRLTPEEWVRQHFLHTLTEIGYPKEKMAVEAAMEVNKVKKRCDAIVYDNLLQPVCIIEFKAPTVALTQHVYDQVAVYNRQLQVRYFILSNGQRYTACLVTETGYHPLEGIPVYEYLCQNK